MELERALYRVYDRCLEGIEVDSSDEFNRTVHSKSCRGVELIVLSFAILCLSLLVALHISFVGKSGCLPMLINDYGHSHPDSNLHLVNDFYYLRDDQVLFLKVDFPGYNGVDSGWYDETRPKRSKSNNSSSVSITDSIVKSITEEYPVGFMASNKNTSFSRHLRKDSEISAKQTNIEVETDDYYDYKYAYSDPLLYLNYNQLMDHKFDLINITMSGKECFGGYYFSKLIPFGGSDMVILNSLMYGVHIWNAGSNSITNSGGSTITSASERYSWSRTDIHYDSASTSLLHRLIYPALGQRNQIVCDWIVYKLKILVISLCAFFYLSAISALLVRMLLSAGVLLMFPLLFFLQMLGCPIPTRMVYLSYPWLGGPLVSLHMMNESTIPFYIGHFARLFIFTAGYQAMQLLCSGVFYGQLFPGMKEYYLYIIMLLWEYFALIYLRSSLGIQFFPRASLALFLLYHFYLYSHPAGFHLLALLAMMLFLFYLMIHTVRKYELPAYLTGVVSEESPRAFYTGFPWPSWGLDVPPDFTMFMPLNRSARGVYQEPVPTLNTPNTNTANTDLEQLVEQETRLTERSPLLGGQERGNYASTGTPPASHEPIHTQHEDLSPNHSAPPPEASPLNFWSTVASISGDVANVIEAIEDL